MNRCSWANTNESEKKYHDTEWGVPVYDDRVLFEFLTLEGAQAGLSWSTILAKRENYRSAFDEFDMHKIAQYDDSKIEELVGDIGIVRHRGKIQSTIYNAKVCLKIQEEFGSLSDYLWSYVDGIPIKNHPKDMSEVPATSNISELLSKDLKKRGCKFVGPTIIYAFMQAVGMVDDHVITCFCKK